MVRPTLPLSPPSLPPSLSPSTHTWYLQYLTLLNLPLPSLPYPDPYPYPYPHYSLPYPYPYPHPYPYPYPHYLTLTLTLITLPYPYPHLCFITQAIVSAETTTSLTITSLKSSATASTFRAGRKIGRTGWNDMWLC